MGQEKVSVLVVFPFQIRRSFHQILPLSSVCYPPAPMDQDCQEPRIIFIRIHLDGETILFLVRDANNRPRRLGTISDIIVF